MKCPMTVGSSDHFCRLTALVGRTGMLGKRIDSLMGEADYFRFLESAYSDAFTAHGCDESHPEVVKWSERMEAQHLRIRDHLEALVRDAASVGRFQ